MPISDRHKGLCVAALLGCCQLASAADLFTVTATVGSQTASIGLGKVNDVFDQLSDAKLNALVPSYNGTQATSMDIAFRGLAMNTAFPIAGGPLLTLNIPRLGISQTFNGGSREASRQLLRDYFKNGDALGRIMQALAELSPVDPIAGNPASLQSRMVTGTYSRNFRALASGVAARSLGNTRVALERPILLASAEDGVPATLGTQGGPLEGGADARAGVMAGADLAHYTGAGLASVVVGLPFGYAFDTAPDRPLSLDGEVQFTDTEGAKTYGVNLNLAYRARINERWYLVPSAGFGVTGSQDLGSVGQIVSAAVTSAFRLYQSADYELWMGNAVNATRTLNVSIGGYSFDPKVHNVAFTNGLLLSTTPSMLMQNYWLEYSFADTRYTGTELFDRRYDEIGVAIARTRSSSWGPTTMRAKLSYLDTTHSRGVGLQLQVSF